MGSFLLIIHLHAGFGLKAMSTLSFTEFSKNSIVNKSAIKGDRRSLW